MEVLIILLLITIFFVLPAISWYRNVSYEYQDKPFRRFFIFLFAIPLSPIIMPIYAIGWVIDYDGVRSMPPHKGYYSGGDYGDGDDYVDDGCD